MTLAITVPLSVKAPGDVRRALETGFVESMDRSLLDDVIVMASELVTNSVEHSGQPEGDQITLISEVTDGVFRLAVIDGGVGMDDPLLSDPSKPPSGLGFVEVLSDRWSAIRGQSFHVWFEIDVLHRRNILCRANT